MTAEEKKEQRAFVEAACREMHLSVDELAAKLDYKSLQRAMWGEIPLPESKRRHIQDLVRLHQAEQQLLESQPSRPLGEPALSRFDTPRAHLATVLRDRGLTVSQLAKLTKYSAAVLEDVIHGTARISEKMARAIVREVPGLEVDELLGGGDSPRVMDESGVRGTHGAAPTVQMPGKGTTRYVPLLSWAAAGQLTAMDALDDAYAHEGVASNVPGRAFAVEVRGDSMHPEINPGDYAVVRSDAEPRPGSVVLVRTLNGDVLCKRYQTKDGGKLVILSSVNRSYEPIEILASEIAWIYPVKQVIRNY